MDKYPSFRELLLDNVEGRDFRIEASQVTGSRLIVLAPHGGGIEPGTSELAREVAGDAFSYYSFVATKKRNNRELHITSHHFDEPRCLEMLARHDYVLALHGCVGEGKAYIGGLDTSFAESLQQVFKRSGIGSQRYGHEFSGAHPMNMCNRGRRKVGVQLELTRDLRAAPNVEVVASAIRDTLCLLTFK